MARRKERESRKRPTLPQATARLLASEILLAASEIEAALRKELPRDEQLQAVCGVRAGAPAGPAGALIAGRRALELSAAHTAGLIKYAINGATLKHLAALCDQLERELDELDDRELDEPDDVSGGARQAVEGKPGTAP